MRLRTTLSPNHSSRGVFAFSIVSRLPATNDVLDAGCGSGRLTKELDVEGSRRDSSSPVICPTTWLRAAAQR